MILSREAILQFIENPRASVELTEARDSQDNHKLHVTGEGFSSERITGIESSINFDIRKKLARPTTTRIYKDVISQYSKVFRAKGFIRDYKFKNNDKDLKNDFKAYLEDIGGGLSIKELMNTVWHKAMFEEFNGVFIVRVPPEHEGENAEPFVEFENIDGIHDIFVKGERVEYIIFTWTTVDQKGNKTEHFKVIDDAFDYHFIRVNGKISLAQREVLRNGEFVTEDDVIPNFWGYVPCIQPSILNKSVLSDTLKKSFVEETMPNADAYLRISNGHSVSITLHQNPIFYSIPLECAVCKGDGQINEDEGGLLGCVKCNGTGRISFYDKSDPSKGVMLPELKEDQEFKGAFSPVGYATIDLETMKEQRIEMEKEEGLIEKGALGVIGVFTSRKTQETAAGKEIDLQPLFDVLTSYSDNGQFIEKFLTDTIGIARYNDSNDTGKRYEGSTVLWGKQYFVRGIDMIVKEYQSAKEAGSPDYQLNNLIAELNFTKFDNNPMALQRSVILNELEPFQTYTLKELVDIGLATPEDMIIKQYFNDFIERFEREETNVVDFMSNGTFENKINKINDKLKEYAQDKVIVPEQEEKEIDMGLVSDLKKNIAAGIETAESAREVLRVQGIKEETIKILIK